MRARPRAAAASPKRARAAAASARRRRAGRAPLGRRARCSAPTRARPPAAGGHRLRGGEAGSRRRARARSRAPRARAARRALRPTMPAKRTSPPRGAQALARSGRRPRRRAAARPAAGLDRVVDALLRRQAPGDEHVRARAPPASASANARWTAGPRGPRRRPARRARAGAQRERAGHDEASAAAASRRCQSATRRRRRPPRRAMPRQFSRTPGGVSRPWQRVQSAPCGEARADRADEAVVVQVQDDARARLARGGQRAPAERRVRLWAWTTRAPVRRTASPTSSGRRPPRSSPRAACARAERPSRARAARRPRRGARGSASEVLDRALLAAGRRGSGGAGAGSRPGQQSWPRAAVIIPTQRRAQYLDVALRFDRAAGARRRARMCSWWTTAATRRRAVAVRHGGGSSCSTPPRGLNAARNTSPRRPAPSCSCFVDDDVARAPGWLAALLAAASAAGGRRGARRPDRRPPRGPRFRTCGREGLPITLPGPGARRHRRAARMGANMTVRRSALERIGPFDERCGLGDEQEWQARLNAAGGRMRYVAAAALEHRRAGDDARLRSLAGGLRRGRARRRYDARGRAPAPSLAAELQVSGGAAPRHGPLLRLHERPLPDRPLRRAA